MPENNIHTFKDRQRRDLVSNNRSVRLNFQNEKTFCQHRVQKHSHSSESNFCSNCEIYSIKKKKKKISLGERQVSAKNLR